MAEPVVPINLEPFWVALRDITQEHGRLEKYTNAARFWETFDTKLSWSYERLRQFRMDMEINTRWSDPGNPRAASTAFYERIDAGLTSILRWRIGGRDLLDGGTDLPDVGTGAVREQFGVLIRQITGAFRAVEEHQISLRQQDRAIGTELAGRRAPHTVLVTVKISDKDQGWIEVPESNADAVNGAVDGAVRLHDDLRRQFELVERLLKALPHNEKWQGPTTLAVRTPSGRSPAAGPGGVSAGPGPDTSDAAPSASEPGVDQPTADQPGDPVPAVNSAVAETSATQPMRSDPELAGTPSAALTPPTTFLPDNNPSAVGTSTGGPGPSGGTLGHSPTLSSVPLTSAGAAARASGGGVSPTVRPGSTVDSGRGRGTPGDSAPGGGQASVLPHGEAAAGVKSGTRVGTGFFPPVMPPMYPRSGGEGGGIRPGDAESAPGSVRRLGGRDAWRAGLRPQLLGRAADYDGERAHDPSPYPVSGGETLDEELWQVPDAAPPTPPEPQPRRGRSWKP